MVQVVLAKENKLEQYDMKKVYIDTQVSLIEKGMPLMLLTADLANSLGLLDVIKKYPDNAMNMGISEQNMASFASGLSISGKIPYIHSFAVFCSRRAHDQIYISGSYAKLNMKIIGEDPGVTAELNGGTHMAMDDINTFRAFPDAKIIEPTDTWMLRDVLQAVAEEYGVHYVRLYRNKAIQIYDQGSKFELGKAVQLREGKEATIIASGICVAEALKASGVLKEQGITVRVLDMFTIKPIDRDSIVSAARETGAIVTAENHSVIGGLYSSVCEVVAEECPVPVAKVGVNDVFGEVGKQKPLMNHYGITAEYIVEQVINVLKRKR